MAASDVFFWLDDVQYKKREFQNRNRIRTPDGAMWLTVPVRSKGRFEQHIREVELDDAAGWRREHWEALRRNYARAPQFKRHAAFFEALYGRPWAKLGELCTASADYIRSEFGIRTPCRYASELSLGTVSTKRLIDLCKAAGADTYLSGAGGKDYLEEALFEQAGLELRYQSFRAPAYRQCFDGFEANMSAIDYLFNVEPSEAKAFFAGAKK